MCKCCEKQEELSTSWITAKIVVRDGVAMIEGEYNAYSCDSSFCDEEIIINYCPMCGTQLTDSEKMV